ncbi:clostripain-related cysteine peptidase [Niabella hirudinis]|uniref:clostripain-related cysteine peptidase n=1 Tax=Niabella hirudinis TaxID=1285929 RepID=UPI003EB859B0
MNLKSFLFFLWVPLVLLFSCSKNDVKPLASKVVMIYMSANNSLASNAFTNINQMEEGFTSINGKLIVYAKIFGQQPCLYEISHDTGPEITSRKIKIYNDHDASNPAIMKMVFNDMESLYPARSYGAILWSHATNWLPKTATVALRSFSDDGGSKMDVQSLKTALPDNLEYLVFDACSMASVEVMYELKDKATYILASPTEVLSVGLPYNLVEKYLFDAAPEQGLRQVAGAYYNYYRSQSGNLQSATYSLIKTSELDGLAKAAKNLFYSHPFANPGFRRSEIQRLDFDPNSPTAGFDFMDFLNKNFDAAALTDIQAAMSKVVLYKVNTPNFLGKPIHAFSGLSCYIPIAANEWAHPFYYTLGWYSAAGVDKLF